MATKFELVSVDWGKDKNEEISRWVDSQLRWLMDSHRELHNSKLPRWRKIYLGTPAEAQRNFPFPNAANTVVQVVGETVDTGVARVMGLLFATHPLWSFTNFERTDPNDQKGIEEKEKRRQAVQDFMDMVGMEPSELDLQRVEAQWYTDAAKLGTSYVKVGMDEQIEAVVVGYEGTKVKGREETLYSGPRVYKLRHEDVLADARCQTLEDCGFVSVRCPLNRVQLEERGFLEKYDKKAVEKVLMQPDRSTPKEPERTELQDQGVSTPSYPDATEEWDVWECYFPYWHKGRKYRIILSYHLKSKVVLRQVYNFMPNNELPIKRAKLGYRTDGLLGHGYAELLEVYQEELSTTHNQRLDNATVANTRALRVSPRARALDSNMELFPTALLIAEKDEVEAIQVGDVYPSTFKNEEMTLGLVARRAGFSPAVSGMGTGQMQKRPAVYSAQGTLAVMQENNSVVGFATSEFRHAHVTLGSLLTSIYGKFGTAGREEMFGIDSKLLSEALTLFEKQRLRIPLRASTGSLNKEIDKQTGLLMAGLMQRHYTAVGQLMQAISNPMVPPETREYFVRVILASTRLHKRIMKDFGYEQPDIFVPDSTVNPTGGSGQPPAPPQAGGVQPGGATGGGPPMARPSQAVPAGGGAELPRGDMGRDLSGIAPNS